MKNHPYVLTIAGFDPSGGAGITADVKTFEALKVYGLSVCTANTIQNDIDFKACFWIDIDVIKKQIEVLCNRFKITHVKIGIVQRWKILNEIIDILIEKNKEIKIILDPIIRSSTHFSFQEISPKPESVHQLDKVLDKIYLLTPNYQEIEKLYVDKSLQETIDYMKKKTNILLKGGHRTDVIGKDELFMKNGSHFTLNPKRQNIYEKHGSGCVLSSAITANLALGIPLLKSCYRAKKYTENFLGSNKSLLGYHSM